MIQTASALKTFFGGFGIPAYTVDSVPENVELPYLTYPLSEPEWSEKATFYAQIWYRTRSNAEVLAKADEIIAAIGTGMTIALPNGYLVIYPESPLVQLLVDGDTRSAYINLSMNAYHMPGI